MVCVLVVLTICCPSINFNYYYSLDTLQEQASLQFDCPLDDVIGVELENQGGSGTAGAHWEHRNVGVINLIPV